MRGAFARCFVGMFVNVFRETQQKWFYLLIEYGDDYTRRNFAYEVTCLLRQRDESEILDWWSNWIREHWQDRLEGVPAPLTPGEANAMLGWICHVGPSFPEAVGLAIQMDLDPRYLDQHFLAELKQELLKPDEELVWLQYPDNAIRLLVHFGRQFHGQGPGWRPEIKELIDRLLQSDGVGPMDKEKLQELKVLKGL